MATHPTSRHSPAKSRRRTIRLVSNRTAGGKKRPARKAKPRRARSTARKEAMPKSKFIVRII